jgi:hypothetical protein
MATPERQALIGASVTDAVATFCAARPPRSRIARPAVATEAAKSSSSSGVLAPLLNLFKRR